MGTADAALENIAIFRFLPPSVRERIALRLKPVSFGFGDVIVREGEPGDAFFVLTSGRARVVKAGEGDEELPLNVLRAGDEFGEMALLQAGPRTATVRCSTDVTALRLDRRDFEELIGEFPEIRQAMELRVRQRTLHTFLREFSELGQLPLPAAARPPGAARARGGWRGTDGHPRGRSRRPHVHRRVGPAARVP